MRASKPAFAFQDPQKPAKERVAEAADRLFRHFGLNISLRFIADFANTREAVAVKYYGSVDRLKFEFLDTLFREMDNAWNDVEKQHRRDPEAQLRNWFFDLSQWGEYSSPHWQLPRVAAQIANPISSPLTLRINKYRQTERQKIEKKCNEAGFRDPGELADKLILLVEGARNERDGYDYPGPRHRLGLAADDLMVAHGATRKPPFDDDPEV